MKIIIKVFLIAALTQLISQENLIRVINLDDSINEYTISEIRDISFDIENQAIAIVSLKDQSESEVQLLSSSKIEFDESRVTFSTLNEKTEFNIADIAKIEFENINEQRYPFGELDVDEIVLNGLNNPWSIDFLSNNELIFTEHDGRLFRYNMATDTREQISGLPSNLAQFGQGGLLDVTLHPDYDNNNIIYLVYSINEGGQSATTVGRGELSGNQLLNFEEIFRGSPLAGGGAHFGSRIIFDKEGKLYFSIGDRGRQNTAQDSTNHNGGVLRINDDGTVTDDNPYLDAPDALPEIYTMGNRNIQGMFYLEEKDEIWAVEHGPRGGDELNIIEAGENYAWPLATYGINYDGTPITEVRSIPGYVDPITYWVPSIAPCGMDMINYNSNSNELDLIIGALAGQHLQRLLIKDNEVIDRVRSLEGYGRFRDVQMSPDGYLYAAVQSPGRIIRLKMKD